MDKRKKIDQLKRLVKSKLRKIFHLNLLMSSNILYKKRTSRKCKYPGSTATIEKSAHKKEETTRNIS